MSAGKILLGVLAGLAAGATLGILFAPDKGTTTRRKIKQKSDEYADQLVEKFNEFVESMTEKFESMKEEVVHSAEGAKEKVEEAAAEAATGVK
jgi:gas vesicle protein